MAMRSKTFAYPYYASFSKDYKEVLFEATWSQNISENDVCVTVFVDIGDKVIKDLIRCRTLSLVCQVSCTNTFFREEYTFEPDSDEIHISIPAYLLDEKTTLTLFIIASKNFLYSNDNFDSFHEGVSYSIEKGNVIGESDDQIYYVHHNDSKNGTSIFTRSFKEGMPEGDPIKVKYNSDAINLEMPRSMYDYLNKAEGKTKNFASIHSMFLAPVLAQTIALMASSDPDDDNSFAAKQNGKKWYSIIDEKIDVSDEFKPEDAWTLAQSILHSPVNNAIAQKVSERKEINSNLGGDGNE